MKEKIEKIIDEKINLILEKEVKEITDNELMILDKKLIDIEMKENEAKTREQLLKTITNTFNV